MEQNKKIGYDISEINNIVQDSIYYVTDLRTFLNGKPVTKSLTDDIKTYNERCKEYQLSYDTGGDHDRIAQLASYVGIYLESISIKLNGMLTEYPEVKSLIDRLNELSALLKNETTERKVTFTISEESILSQRPKNSVVNKQGISLLEEDFKKYQKQINESEERYEKRISLLSTKLAETEDALEKIQAVVQAKIETVDLLYTNSLHDLNEKKNTVDELIGTISAGVIAGNYD